MKKSGFTRLQLAGLLRAHGVTPTEQRILIARTLFRRAEHVSTEELVALARRTARVSKATVYNTLSLFLAKNLVRQVTVEPGRIFYDPNVTPHHHLYDIDTGRLVDIRAEDMHVTGLPRLPRGVTADRVDIIVRVRSR